MKRNHRTITLALSCALSLSLLLAAFTPAGALFGRKKQEESV